MRHYEAIIIETWLVPNISTCSRRDFNAVFITDIFIFKAKYLIWWNNQTWYCGFNGVVYLNLKISEYPFLIISEEVHWFLLFFKKTMIETRSMAQLYNLSMTLFHGDCFESNFTMQFAILSFATQRSYFQLYWVSPSPSRQNYFGCYSFSHLGVLFILMSPALVCIFGIFNFHNVFSFTIVRN